METAERFERVINAAKDAAKALKDAGSEIGGFTKFLAKYIEESGAVFPICKVGDKVYIPDQFGRIEAEIDRIEITEDGIRYEWAKYDRGVDETELWDDGSFESSDVGKTVFLSFEEYEKVYGGSTDESSSEEY